MSVDEVYRDLVDMIQHYKESLLVQDAINDKEKYSGEKLGRVQETEQVVEMKKEVSEAPVKKKYVLAEQIQTQMKSLHKGS